MSEDVLVPGGRDVRGTLDTPDGEATACVVACPPHPQYGGKRTDARLRALADALTSEGVACLRFDYGDWDEGRGERTDVRQACRWARGRFGDDRVGLFGYSFGGAVALLAAAADGADGRNLQAVVALAPGAGITGGVERPVPEALGDIAAPVRIVYGSRDTTANWEPVVERARELGLDVVEMSADHHFVGQADKAADHAAEFLLARR
ncbi:alpha/beta hydrolase [Haloglomus halophilum]|uniref:alpha/beta hydrolase n=1 Tax=Haloglomus halophilum TaxID=2962672 RepID=UPI0020CA10D4|nr:alpha/beta hydrolase [Haloglomus halophilum]